jgi:hypothetical protein
VIAEAPHYSVVARDRLVAYVWVRPAGGQLRRAGNAGMVICDVPWAEVHVLDRMHEKLLVGLVPDSKELDAWLFKLQLEGLRVENGKVQPAYFMRSF